MVYLGVFLYLQFSTLPTSTSLLKHNKIVADALLDEEFLDSDVPNHKKSWYDIKSTTEMWQWIEGPLYGSFYHDESSPDIPQPLLGSNHLLGAIDIRQMRTRTVSCNGFGAASALGLSHCAVGWSKDSALAGSMQDAGQSAWQLAFKSTWADNEREMTSEIKGSPLLVGDRMGVTNDGTHHFGTNGYAVTLPRNGTLWRQKVEELRQNNFVDEHTRALVVQFNLYNSADMNTKDLGREYADQFVVVQIVFTIDPTAHIENYERIIAVRPMRNYAYMTGTSLLGIALLWVAITVLLIVKELLIMRKNGFILYFYSGPHARAARLRCPYARPRTSPPRCSLTPLSLQAQMLYGTV